MVFLGNTRVQWRDKTIYSSLLLFVVDAVGIWSTPPLPGWCTWQSSSILAANSSQPLSSSENCPWQVKLFQSGGYSLYTSHQKSVTDKYKVVSWPEDRINFVVRFVSQSSLWNHTEATGAVFLLDFLLHPMLPFMLFSWTHSPGKPLVQESLPQTLLLGDTN